MSYLQIYDLETRTAKVVKEFPYTIEAPNWSPDGQWLLVNKGGRLYKIAVDGSTDLVEIPTGSIMQCNNDHVISADGKWIGLSSNGKEVAYCAFRGPDQEQDVFFEMDVYWAVMAGVSPVGYMKRYPGRFELLHIKDQNEIGQSGMVGFDAIFRNFKVAGTRAFVVELEGASTANILRGLRESASYLRHSEYVQ